MIFTLVKFLQSLETRSEQITIIFIQFGHLGLSESNQRVIGSSGCAKKTFETLRSSIILDKRIEITRMALNLKNFGR